MQVEAGLRPACTVNNIKIQVETGLRPVSTINHIKII
jgi:hypothetical protein